MQYIAAQDAPLIDILTLLSPSSSKTTLRSWIKEGRIQVDEEEAKQANQLVSQGQKVALLPRSQSIGHRIKVIYEDRHLIAIEKPSGLLSVATAFEKGETAHALLKKHFQRKKVFVVHRLDQDTSGVMLFALSQEGYDGLKALFEAHDITREYCAIVEGSITPAKGSWKSFLYEDPQYKVHSTQDPSRGAPAVTHYKTVATSSRYSRLVLALETGRKNQIRVHCQDAGHSVVGDKKYGAQSDPLKRLCLHAQTISFVHPISKKPMKFHSPPPSSFNRLVAHA